MVDVEILDVKVVDIEILDNEILVPVPKLGIGYEYNMVDVEMLESSHLFANLAEDERDVNATIEERGEMPNVEVEMVVDDDIRFQEFLARHKKIKDKYAHYELRNALIEHLWDEYTNSKN
ncbi:unnamed protein product [Lactuca virosa]|uniref:Uncharacterized protein n=1 Tax=Lactuca virosa TaxID=75947 RepID=A0AAU9M770_9ASTR|nr:unnamed protein product [Lactuca virosa]